MHHVWAQAKPHEMAAQKISALEFVSAVIPYQILCFVRMSMHIVSLSARTLRLASMMPWPALPTRRDCLELCGLLVRKIIWKCIRNTMMDGRDNRNISSKKNNIVNVNVWETTKGRFRFINIAHLMLRHHHHRAVATRMRNWCSVRVVVRPIQVCGCGNVRLRRWYGIYVLCAVCGNQFRFITTHLHPFWKLCCVLFVFRLFLTPAGTAAMTRFDHYFEFV